MPTITPFINIKGLLQPINTKLHIEEILIIFVLLANSMVAV